MDAAVEPQHDERGILRESAESQSFLDATG
jgi:hypothetical protein